MTPLERRYRRLLTSYPKEHRARHEEEMIAVLLAGSSPGRRRPTARDAFDVLRGGLAIRLHRAVKPEARRQWHDAVNLAALIAPIALFIGLLFRAAAYTGRALPAFLREEALQLLELVVFALPYGLVALLAWLGRPRAAIACAWAYAALLAVSRFDREPVHVVSDGVTHVMERPVELGGFGLAMLPIALCAVMLTLAPSPGPGPLGTRRLLAWSAAAFAAVAAAPLVSAAAIVLFLVAALVMALRSPVGRRTAVALVPLLLVFAGGLPGAGDLTNLAALATVSAVVLGLTAWLARTGEATSSPADG